MVAGGAFAIYAIRTNQSEAAPASTIGRVPVPAERETSPKPHQPPITATNTTIATPSEVTRDAASRDASWREAREAAIRIQQRLRTEEQARKSMQQEETKRERCVDGQRMKRVENGWVQAGPC
ncbi:MAG TPA: hypothetical protein VGQ93_14695 [Lysobacter sp.]|nr:hypothetical protein [Lysobacter sp.]